MKNKGQKTQKKKDALRPTMKDWMQLVISDKDSVGVRETQQVLRELRYGK